MSEIYLFNKKSAAPLRATIFYPNTYFTGMSSLSLHGLFYKIDNHKYWIAERYFSDTNSKYTIDNNYLVSDSDVIAITVSFEPDYLNIIKFLKNFKIPLDARLRNKFHPFIIIGGAITYYSPRPLKFIADLIFLGDAENILKDFLSTFKTKNDRKTMWEYFDNHPNIITPYSNDKNKKPAFINNKFKPWRSWVITNNTEFENTFLIEISRGCRFKCPFCTVGYNFGNYRSADTKAIISNIESIQKNIKHIGLVTANATDFLELETLIKHFPELSFSFSSLRFDSLKPEFELDPSFQKQISLTIGLESGSERLRKKIGKIVNTNKLFEKLEFYNKTGKTKLKLYVMYGLPEETEEDIVELFNLLKEIERIWKKGSIMISLNGFVPLPKTPWENHKFNINLLKNRKKLIKSLFSSSGLNKTTYKIESLKNQHLQYTLSWADENFLINKFRI